MTDNLESHSSNSHKTSPSPLSSPPLRGRGKGEGVTLAFIPQKEFIRVEQSAIAKHEKLLLLADMCRVNTLVAVKHAGSGHLGSSFSSLDIVTYLYYSEMNVREVGIRDPNRDIYFSSKGHDAPGLYAVLYSLGILPEDQLLKLRRWGGPCGHPDLATPGVEASTGSLGMGISKGKGIALAKKMSGLKGQVFVMTGDGELQEGQIYEALQTAAHQRVGNLTVIVDNNKVQSDRLIGEIVGLGNLESKFSAFGWQVARCDGHDFKQLESVFEKFKTVSGQPKILIADTVKGRGVSFMEHLAALQASGGSYPWHAGAPSDEPFQKAYDEMMARIRGRFAKFGLGQVSEKPIAAETKPKSSVSSEYVVDAFGKALVEIAAKRKDLVVLDADLALDCRIREFEKTYPERFIENGIAEQDMVSMAGGLARQGFLPVVNSFASFLVSKANEQIYNNACEKSRIIYAAHYAGLIPAGPGQSHQSLRDISLLGALPNFLILEPCNAKETKMVVEYAVNRAKENCVIRLVIGPSPRVIELPPDYQLEPGRGAVLTEGSDAVLFAYGPVMLHEALMAAELGREKKFYIKVINMPWLNQVDIQWLSDTLRDIPSIFVLEDHSPTGGLGDYLLNQLIEHDLLEKRVFKKMGIKGLPAWGTPQEALCYHGLDASSIVDRILKNQPVSKHPEHESHLHGA